MSDANTCLTAPDTVLPAEWAPQSAIQLTWPHEQTDWQPYLEAIVKTFVEMTCAITKYEDVLIVTPHPEKAERQLATRLTTGQLARVHFCPCETNDTWARDHGVITLTAPDGMLTHLDFHFNGWGEKFESAADNRINRHLKAAGLLPGRLEAHDDFVLEGGSIESDGRGTLFTTSQCLLAPHRNQPLTQAEIERELMRRLHARRIVWLDHGNLVGDDTDGHIDTTVRIAPADTLLYMTVSNPSDPQYDDFQALKAQLQMLETAEGTPYRLLPLPCPAPIYDDGERLPATYANFLILNGAVIVPTYGQPLLDQEAITVIAEAFPGRDIIGIDARTIIRQHGSIHCLTMQIPTSNK